MGRVSRNGQEKYDALQREVAPRMGRVSRNMRIAIYARKSAVAPRMGRVSRNPFVGVKISLEDRRAPHEACE